MGNDRTLPTQIADELGVGHPLATLARRERTAAAKCKKRCATLEAKLEEIKKVARHTPSILRIIARQ